MKKKYTIAVMTALLSIIASGFSQSMQKNRINYQGVVRDADGQVMGNQNLTLGVALSFGGASTPPIYTESHQVTTDVDGVFSLQIGGGTPTQGNFEDMEWGGLACFMTISMDGTQLGTTELMAVPYAISSGDGAQQANEVPYDNSGSTLAATNLQQAIDELVGSRGADADADPENELQTLAFNTETNELSLSNGNSVTIPSGGTDADADPMNELEDISLDGTELSITEGSTVDLAPLIPPGGTDDQNLELTGDVLSIEGGSGSVDLSNYINDADADPNNEVDVTEQNGILLGDGNVVTGLVGTSNGQVPKWNSTTSSWEAGTDATGSGGSGTPTGLEALDQGNGEGHRLIGRDPIFYANIGQYATDLSFNDAGASFGAGGESSFAAGRTTWAGGLGSAALGHTVYATGDYAFAAGKQTDASAQSATSLGEETEASGIRSTALGYRSEASGAVSFTVGEETLASGEFAVAMGDRTQATEQSSTAFGAGSVASGTHSTAMGNATEASGTASTAMGSSTKAESLASVVLGRNNVGGGDAFTWQPNDPLFEVGNGTSATPSNALTILKSGNVGIGSATPSESLEVDGTIRSTDLSGTGQRNVVADADGNLMIGSSGGGSSSVWSQNGTDTYYNLGNVGIGTDSPIAGLHINLNSEETARFQSSVANSYTTYRNNNGYIGYAGVFSGDDDMDFGTGFGNTTGKVNLTIGALPILTIDSDGDVGIGTTNPSASFHISTSASFTEPQLRLEETSTDFTRLELKNQSPGFWHISGRGGGSSRLNFYYNDGNSGQDVMTINGSGNVGIGTNDSDRKLTVEGDIKTSGEVHGQNTGNANMLASSYGKISSSGGIFGGSNNFTVNKTGVGEYQITIEDMSREDLADGAFVATPVIFFGEPLLIGIGQRNSGGVSSVIVRIFNISGAQIDSNFSFIFYKP